MNKEVREKRFIAYRGKNIHDIKEYYGVYDENTIDDYIYSLLEEIGEDYSSRSEEVQEVNEEIYEDAYRSYEKGNYFLSPRNFTDLYNEYFYLDHEKELNIVMLYKF